MIPVSVEIDQRALLASFIKLEGLYTDLAPVFEAVGEEGLSDIRHHIDSHPGPPLKAATIKKKGSTRILRDKDDLYGSFVRGAVNNVFRLSSTEVEVGTADFKAQFHQEGRGVPKRVIVEKVSSDREAKYTRIAVDVQLRRIRELGFEAH